MQAVVLLLVSALGCGGGQPAAQPAQASVGPGNQDATADLRAQVQRLTTEVAALQATVAQLVELQAQVAELDARTEAEAARPAPPRPRSPDPDQVYALPITGSPYRGARDALVTIVQGTEFACPYCEKVRPTIDALLDAYPGELKVVHKHFVVHPQTATVPAQASCAAARQGKFFEMHELIWDEAYPARDFSEAKMEELAKKLKLDIHTFRADMTGPCPQVVTTDQAQLSAVGMRGTPSFYINGRFLSGARPIDNFKVIIDEELAKARDRVAAGQATASSYYDTFVIQAGKTRLD